MLSLCTEKKQTEEKSKVEAKSSEPLPALHTHPFNGPFSGTTQVSRYQKGKTNLDFTEARDSEWQWHQLGHMQVCTSLQTDNHASTPLLSFLQARCPSCRPTNSVKALKATSTEDMIDMQWKSKCLEKMLAIIALVAIYKQSDNVKRNHQ